jgi:disulfide bond formation protein DsbB
VTHAVTTFLTILAVLGQLAVAALALLALAARWSPGARGALDALRRELDGAELALAWLVATIATAGSLYYSEVADFVPCTLCWYQRIAMYPLVVLLGIAAVRRDRGIVRYALPLAAIGAAISVYHYQLEWFPHQEGAFCHAGVPCSVRWVFELGYISLPLLALTAFTLIGSLLLLARR